MWEEVVLFGNLDGKICHISQIQSFLNGLFRFTVTVFWEVLCLSSMSFILRSQYKDSVSSKDKNHLENPTWSINYRFDLIWNPLISENKQSVHTITI